MTKLEIWILLANFHLDIQANSYTIALEWVASRFSLPVGETDALAPVRAKEWVWERGRVRVMMLRQMTPVAPESLTCRLRYATARQAVLSPSRSREATERASGIKPEMNLTK
jgi:hypothetical protein